MQSSTAYKIGRFQILRRLGRGSEGTVYLALDPNLDRRVAIKVLRTRVSTAEGVASFPSEARNVARLSHPNIVAVHEAGMHHGTPFLVFEYVNGKTLKGLLNQHGALSEERACVLMSGVLEGIAYAHARGIIHLDLSPRNIMLDAQGKPQVMDFGLSKWVGFGGDSQNSLCGTPRYMSPEHFDGTQLSARTDVFALGLICYEMLTGKPAIEGNSSSAIAYKIACEPLDLSALNELSIQLHLRQFICKALQRDPATRFADGQEMKQALELRCTAVSSTAQDEDQVGTHGTVDFLLRRMRRRDDFPAISSVLLEINRLTTEQHAVDMGKLASVILQDYALTKKILKMANSSLYCNFEGRADTVSRAITILGVDQVRMASSGMYFDIFKAGKNGKSDRDREAGSELYDILVSSFVAGLIARYAANLAGLASEKESAFIGGLFHNVGKSLAIYYFAEEYEAAKQLVASKGLTQAEASQRVLGLSYNKLGAAVARVWKFPDTLIRCMREPSDHPLQQDVEATERLWHFATFANELVENAGSGDVDDKQRQLTRLATRYSKSVPIPAEKYGKVLSTGLVKLESFDSALGIATAKNHFVQRAKSWLAFELCELPEGATEQV